MQTNRNRDLFKQELVAAQEPLKSKIKRHVYNHTYLETTDILQETNCRALGSWETYDPNKAKMLTWLWKIAKRVMWAKTSKVRDILQEQDTPNSSLGFTLYENNICSLLTLKEALKVTFKPEQIEILLKLDEQSPRSLAREYKRSIQSIYSLKHRAKKMMKQSISENNK